METNKVDEDVYLELNDSTINIPTPINTEDIANKAYVDSMVTSMGPITLNSLNDVTITGPVVDAQYLKYNTTEWINEDIVPAETGLLDGTGKLDAAYIPSYLIGSIKYVGDWNANTNTPTLGNGGTGGVKGDYYVVSVDGTTSIDGIADWTQRDVIINNGSVWQKIDNTNTVTSVFGRTSAITAQSGDYNLSELGDCTVITPTNNDYLVYTASTSQWQNGSAPPASSVFGTHYKYYEQPAGIYYSSTPNTWYSALILINGVTSPGNYRITWSSEYGSTGDFGADASARLSLGGSVSAVIAQTSLSGEPNIPVEHWESFAGTMKVTIASTGVYSFLLEIMSTNTLLYVARMRSARLELFQIS